MRGMTLTNTVTRKELATLQLRGKPKCVCCGRPLTFIYEGATGFTGEKCSRCGQAYLVNTETLEVRRVMREAV